MVAQPIIHAIAPGKDFEDRKAIAGKRWLDGTVARKNRCDGIPDSWEHNWVPQDFTNRVYLDTVEKQPQSRTFEEGKAFLKENHQVQDWFLQIETFDPHEPFFSHERFKKLLDDPYRGPVYDWPDYRSLDDRDTLVEIQHLRAEYGSLLAMCDEKLGEVLDLLDQYDMWKDTMVIVNTDHGFLLSEHGIHRLDGKGFIPLVWCRPSIFQQRFCVNLKLIFHSKWREFRYREC